MSKPSADFPGTPAGPPLQRSADGSHTEWQPPADAARHQPHPTVYKYGYPPWYASPGPGWSPYGHTGPQPPMMTPDRSMDAASQPRSHVMNHMPSFTGSQPGTPAPSCDAFAAMPAASPPPYAARGVGSEAHPMSHGPAAEPHAGASGAAYGPPMGYSMGLSGPGWHRYPAGSYAGWMDLPAGPYAGWMDLPAAGFASGRFGAYHNDSHPRRAGYPSHVGAGYAVPYSRLASGHHSASYSSVSGPRTDDREGRHRDDGASGRVSRRDVSADDGDLEAAVGRKRKHQQLSRGEIRHAHGGSSGDAHRDHHGTASSSAANGSRSGASQASAAAGAPSHRLGHGPSHHRDHGVSDSDPDSDSGSDSNSQSERAAAKRPRSSTAADAGSSESPSAIYKKPAPRFRPAKASCISLAAGATIQSLDASAGGRSAAAPAASARKEVKVAHRGDSDSDSDSDAASDGVASDDAGRDYGRAKSRSKASVTPPKSWARPRPVHPSSSSVSHSKSASNPAGGPSVVPQRHHDGLAAVAIRQLEHGSLCPGRPDRMLVDMSRATTRYKRAPNHWLLARFDVVDGRRVPLLDRAATGDCWSSIEWLCQRCGKTTRTTSNAITHSDSFCPMAPVKVAQLRTATATTACSVSREGKHRAAARRRAAAIKESSDSAESDAEPDSDSESDAEPYSDSDSETESDSDSETESDSDSGTESDSDSGTESDSDSESEEGSSSGRASDVDADSDDDSVGESDCDSQPRAGAVMGIKSHAGTTWLCVPAAIAVRRMGLSSRATAALARSRRSVVLLTPFKHGPAGAEKVATTGSSSSAGGAGAGGHGADAGQQLQLQLQPLFDSPAIALADERCWWCTACDTTIKGDAHALRHVETRVHAKHLGAQAALAETGGGSITRRAGATSAATGAAAAPASGEVDQVHGGGAGSESE